EKELADLAWLPTLYVGAAYYRHEGGIQDETGVLIHSSSGAVFAGGELGGEVDVKDALFPGLDAPRQPLAPKGALTQLPSQVLLEAASSYVDLLQARSAEAVAAAMDLNYQQLLEDAQRRAQAGHPTPRDAEQGLLQTEAEVARHHRAMLRARQQGDVAAVKLAR